MRTLSRLFAICLISIGLIAMTSVTNAATLNTSLSKVKTVKATALDRSVTLTWTKTPSTSKFKVSGYQIKASKGTWSSTKTVAASVISFRFTGLTNNSSYRFVVSTLSGKYISPGVTVSATPKTGQLANSLIFGQPSDMYLSAADQQLYATASGSTVIFESLSPNICSIIGSKVHAKALGDCILRASSPAGGGYLASSSVDRLITIGTEVAAPKRVLLWSDEFSMAPGSAPDAAKWTADTTDGCGAPYNNCGWGNNERQYYLTSKNTHDGTNQGNLTITATRQTNSTNYNCYFGKCEWLSGKITTYNKVGFSYGYMESRIRLAPGGGTWPAFWMLGSNIATVPWPACGELDIMEYQGNDPRVAHSAIHYPNSGGSHIYTSAVRDAGVDLGAGYHRYGMMWAADEISFYIDDNLIYSMRKADSGSTKWPFGKSSQGVDPSFYLVYNLAMGGNFGGSIDSSLNSSSMSIDWVRYYSVDGVGKVNAK